MPLLADAENEIGRLTLALAEAKKRAERDYLRFAEADRKEIERLREENARLREALKELIEDHEYMTDTDAEEDNLARAHARAAIREGGK